MTKPTQDKETLREAVALVSFGVWLIVSLIAWLIYALAT